MNKSMRCPGCGAGMTVTREDHDYAESGLPGVTLVGIEVRRCASCDESMPLIPSVAGLHRAIARAIVERSARMSGEELRYLRVYLDLRAVDLARIMGVTKECVSRWENNHEAIGGAADRMLRLLVLNQKPVSDYTPARLAKLLADIGDERLPLTLRLERRPGGWAGCEAPSDTDDADSSSQEVQKGVRARKRRRKAA